MSDKSGDETDKKKRKISNAEKMREYRRRKKTIRSTPKTGAERTKNYYLKQKLIMQQLTQSSTNTSQENSSQEFLRVDANTIRQSLATRIDSSHISIEHNFESPQSAHSQQIQSNLDFIQQPQLSQLASQTSQHSLYPHVIIQQPQLSQLSSQFTHSQHSLYPNVIIQHPQITQPSSSNLIYHNPTISGSFALPEKKLTSLIENKPPIKQPSTTSLQLGVQEQIHFEFVDPTQVIANHGTPSVLAETIKMEPEDIHDEYISPAKLDLPLKRIEDIKCEENEIEIEENENGLLDFAQDYCSTTTDSLIQMEDIKTDCVEAPN